MTAGTIFLVAVLLWLFLAPAGSGYRFAAGTNRPTQADRERYWRSLPWRERFTLEHCAQLVGMALAAGAFVWLVS